MRYCYRIDSQSIVKIADFGMSREVNENDYYRMADRRKPLPVRWLAIECLKHGKFSAKSDVVCLNITKQTFTSMLFNYK